MIGASRWAIASPHQAQDTKGAVDRPPAIDDAAEKIAGKERLKCALRLHQGQENLEAAIHAKPLGSENFALGKAANDAPKSWHGRENAAALVSVKIGTGVSLRQITIRGDARMPLSLAPEEMDLLRALSEPIDQRRRTEFMAEAARRIEEASPRGGHRIGRATQRDYFDPPMDLRQNRVGPRGPRS
jgi:hypothetical protein